MAALARRPALHAALCDSAAALRAFCLAATALAGPEAAALYRTVCALDGGI